MSGYNDFIYGLGDFFTMTFRILPALGNAPNYLFALLMLVGTIYWLNWQKNLSREAKDKGKPE